MGGVEDGGWDEAGRDGTGGGDGDSDSAGPKQVPDGKTTE